MSNGALVTEKVSKGLGFSSFNLQITVQNQIYHNTEALRPAIHFRPVFFRVYIFDCDYGAQI